MKIIVKEGWSEKSKMVMIASVIAIVAVIILD